MQQNSNNIFDKFEIICQLRNVGFTKSQAKAFHKIFANHSNHNDAASKQDILDIRNDIVILKQEIEKSELRMIIKLGSILTLAIGLMTSLKMF